MNQRRIFSASLLAALAILPALAGTASATVLTSPTGTTYTGEIKAEAGTTELHGPFTTVSCTRSTFAGKVEKHGSGVTAGGNISSLTFTGCNFPVTVLKPGSLEIHHTSGYNGTVTSTGAEITIATSIANCLYKTSGTDVGTLTGGSPAKLDIDSSPIPRTGHSFFCGSSGEWTGSYTVTTPGSLYVDAGSGWGGGGGEEGHPLRNTPGALYFKAGVIESKSMVLERSGSGGVTTEGASFQESPGVTFSGIDFDGGTACYVRSYGTSCTINVKNTRSTPGNGFLVIKTSAGDKWIPIHVTT